MRRLLAGLAFSATLIAVIGVAGTPALAQNGNAQTGSTGGNSPAKDPGTCGVRVGMESHPPLIIYVIRNKCLTAYNFAVKLPGTGRYANPRCQSVVGGETETFSSVIVDGNWRIELC